MASDENEYDDIATYLAKAQAKLADYQRRHRNNNITVGSLAYFFVRRDQIKSVFPEEPIEPYFDNNGELVRIQIGAETGDTDSENSDDEKNQQGGGMSIGVTFNRNFDKLRPMLKTGMRPVAGKNRATYAKGVYIFSVQGPDQVHKFGVAFGAGGLYERLKSYRLCFPQPDKIVIKYLIIASSTEKARALEKLFLDHQKLKKAPNQYSREWQSVRSRKLMEEVMIDILNRSDLWERVAVLWENGNEIHPKSIERKKGTEIRLNDLQRKPSSTRRVSSLA